MIFYLAHKKHNLSLITRKNVIKYDRIESETFESGDKLVTYKKVTFKYEPELDKQLRKAIGRGNHLFIFMEEIQGMKLLLELKGKIHMWETSYEEMKILIAFEIEE